MTAPEIVIVRTGIANVASVANALTRLGAAPLTSGDAARVREAPLAVLPGNGAFGPAMREIRQSGLDTAILDRVRLDRPLLAICLGLQLLCKASEEGEGEAGLGVAPGTVRRFSADLRAPQMGWNWVSPTANAAMLRPGAMYFAHSYRLETLPQGWEGATAEYGGRFVAAMERGPVLACQFHPELSGQAGLGLIGRWLAFAAGGAPC